LQRTGELYLYDGAFSGSMGKRDPGGSLRGADRGFLLFGYASFGPGRYEAHVAGY